MNMWLLRWEICVILIICYGLWLSVVTQQYTINTKTATFLEFSGKIF